MPTALVQTQAYGARSKYFAKIEATYNTVAAWAAADGVDLDSLKLEPSVDQQLSKQHTGSCSPLDVINGRRGGKWTATASVFRAASLGTAPDLTALLKASFGTETLNGGTSVVYTLSNVANSLQLAVHDATGYYQVANGACVEKLEVKATGGGLQLTFSGSFASYGWAHWNEVGAAGALQNATTVPYTSTYKGAIGVGAAILVGAGANNAGAGYLVTAVDDAAYTLTITPGLTEAVTQYDTIRPVTPTGTYSGTRIAVVGHGLSIDGTSVGFEELTVTLETGFKLREKEATSTTSGGVLFEGPRKITCDITALYQSLTHGPLCGQAFASSVLTHAIIARLGANTAAARVSMSLPKVVFAPSDPELTDEGAARVKLAGSFTLQNSAEYDEMVWTLN